MPVEPFELSKSHSIACLQIIRIWASQLAPGTEQDQIVKALGELAVAMRVPEKMEPGARGATEQCGADAAPKSSERRESGSRSAEVEPEGRRAIAQSTEKLVPGSRSATPKQDARHTVGKITEKLVPGSRSA